MHAFSKRLQSADHVPGTRVVVVSSEPGALGSPAGRPAGDPWTVWAQHRLLLSGVQGRLISSSKGKGPAGWQGPGASLRGGVGLSWPPHG